MSALGAMPGCSAHDARGTADCTAGSNGWLGKALGIVGVITAGRAPTVAGDFGTSAGAATLATGMALTGGGMFLGVTTGAAAIFRLGAGGVRGAVGFDGADGFGVTCGFVATGFMDGFGGSGVAVSCTIVTGIMVSFTCRGDGKWACRSIVNNARCASSEIGSQIR
jgi:hypothetical protein